MGAEEDINEFEKWARSLGCPAKAMPPKKTLSRIFSSGKALAFQELMRRVRPQEEVKAIRDEVKVRKIELLGGKSIGVKKVQSEQMYLYETKKKMEDKLEKQKSQINSKKQEYQKLAASSKAYNVEKLQLEEEISNIGAKNAICRLKTSDIERQIVAEKEISKGIDEITPVKFTVNSSMDKKAADAMVTVKAELQKFYATFSLTENYEVNLMSRQQLWQNMRSAFAQIPNFVLWTTICDQIKHKLTSMEALAKMDMEKILYVDFETSDPSRKDNLRIETGKLYAKHIKLCIMRHGAEKKSEGLMNDYVVSYEAFLHDMRTKFTMYNNQNFDDDFLGDYLGLYSTFHYGKGEVEYLLKVVNENEQKIQRTKKSNEEYLVANTELEKTYAEMENLYIRAHEDLYNLSHVREKIQHSVELIQYLLQCKKDHGSTVNLEVPGHMNNSINSSYSSSNDSLLTSSRSDNLSAPGSFRTETAMTRSMPATTLSNHLNEIKTFLNIPIDKFKLRNPSRDHMDLCLNPLVNPKVYSQLPNEVKLLICDYLITPDASIKQLRSQINWFKQMEAVGEFVAPDGLPEVDESKLIAKKNQQNNELAELTDETTAICANTHRIFNQIERYIEFIRENPLRKWVPISQTFNGKNYQEYEREFMMYYKMIQKPEGV